jgi:quinol monooxygenase YgiN
MTGLPTKWSAACFNISPAIVASGRERRRNLSEKTDNDYTDAVAGKYRTLRHTIFMRSVMTIRNSSRPIARVFRATAAPGCRDELLKRFHSSSAALVNSKVGCLKYRILEPADASAPEVVFESIWRDLDAVKVAFGDAWQQSHLPEGYSALMTAYSVHHFLVSENSTTK